MKGIGIGPTDLNSLQDYHGGIPFLVYANCVAATSTYVLFPGGAPYPVRVLGMEGIMTAAGGALDTVALQDGSSNVIITAVDVSALLIRDKWDASTVDSTYWNINRGDNLQIVTVSGAVCFVTVTVIRTELTT